MHHHGRKRSKSAWIFLGVMTLAAGAQAQALLTRESGAPVGDNQNSQTAGPNGPTLL